MFFLLLLAAVGGTSNEHDFASGCRIWQRPVCFSVATSALSW
jgi:hypothetical protein